jgi:hypothetical protein
MASHIPGIYKVHTDCLSRLELTGDYQVDRDLLFNLLKKWRIFQDVDLFFTSTTNLSNKFYSVRNTAGQLLYFGNAMHISWLNMTLIIHPPISLINRSLEKFLREGELGVVILPI